MYALQRVREQKGANGQRPRHFLTRAISFSISGSVILGTHVLVELSYSKCNLKSRQGGSFPPPSEQPAYWIGQRPWPTETRNPSQNGNGQEGFDCPGEQASRYRQGLLTGHRVHAQPFRDIRCRRHPAAGRHDQERRIARQHALGFLSEGPHQGLAKMGLLFWTKKTINCIVRVS